MLLPIHSLQEPCFRLSLIQANPIVGDLSRNRDLVTQFYHEAKTAGANLVIFPEMFLTGYQTEDLVLQPDFQHAIARSLETISALTLEGPDIILGSLRVDGAGHLYNSLFHLSKGAIITHQDKICLPNYGVFDEERLFLKGKEAQPIKIDTPSGPLLLGFGICEDFWNAHLANDLKAKGADLLISINGSPFEVDKRYKRHGVMCKRAQETGLPLIYLNLIGGQDELVFDGGSFMIDDKGETIMQAPWFESHISHIDMIEHNQDGTKKWQVDEGGLVKSPTLSREAMLYNAMKLGLYDYITKNGFKGVCLGLSGGIDSALSAAVAVDVLGSDRVVALYMPSPYSSQMSLEDAKKSAEFLEIPLHIVPIDGVMKACHEALIGPFPDGLNGLAAENIQARIRGNLLMSYSNSKGLMVLTTGNKSEIATGYATLYGDMCGGYSVLKDLYKTDVFKLSRWRNAQTDTPAIPENTITKPPTAELRENQKDSDSLPDYEILDRLLFQLIECNQGMVKLCEMGFDEAMILKIVRLLRASEYKRRQSAPGVKLSSLSFGRDWRYPMTNHYHYLDN